MASANIYWPEDTFACPICLDVFSSPLTTPCGHNFCRPCITKFWDEQVQYKCPVCNKLFPTRPDLQVNTLLSELAAQNRASVQVEEQPCGEPGDVPCDVCTGTQLKAVKSCLICLTSYCHTHLEPHQRIAGLRSHKLVEPMVNLEDHMCPKHGRLLELFCQTEQVCVCQLCLMDHKSHPVVPLQEEYEMKMAQLGKMMSDTPLKIQERKQKIKDIKDDLQLSKHDADKGAQVFAALVRCRDDFNKTVQENMKPTEKLAEDLIKGLEREIKDLTDRSVQVTQLSQTEEHLHFLQTFHTSMKNLPLMLATPSLRLRPPSHFETLRRFLDQLEETLYTERKKIPEMKKIPGLKPDIKNYACELTLDKKTVHRHLSLSEDDRTVTQLGIHHWYHVCPERFDYHRQVLCSEGLTGRCYWEVDWDGEVDIGVTYRDIQRKGRDDDCELGQNPMSWCLHCDDDSDDDDDDVYSAWYNGSKSTTDPSLPLGSNTVGVYLDWQAGYLSFYEVDQGRESTHIHTFQFPFSQELYPAFKLYDTDSSVSLCEL